MKLKPGDTLMVALMRAGCDPREAHEAIVALSELYNPRKLKVGQVLTVVMDPGEDAGRAVLHGITLASAPGYSVEVGRAAVGDFYAAREVEVPMARELIHVGGRIQSSLYQSAVDVGLPVPVLMEMIKAFSFDVDFQREIQQGDRFELLYDSFYDRAGELAKTGPLKYASMVLSGKRLEFYRFVLPDGSDDHFDANGRSVRRALLKTPVDGARISSGFGMRKHPIQGYNKMHRGVDFAAPRGTPVYAAGKGVIDRIGRNGGYGKYVRIRHNSTYKTAYAHMKSYAKGMKRGVRVKQGQVIGYVGSTGNSTGPHLHYEILVDNKQVNPRKIKLPSGKSLKGADLEAFQQVRAEIDRLRGQSLPDLQMVQGGCGSDLPITPAASDNAAGTAAGAETC